MPEKSLLFLAFIFICESWLLFKYKDFHMSFTIMKLTNVVLLFIFLIPETLNAKPEFPIQLFQLNQVQLLESPFKTAMELDKAYLLDLEPDRFLSDFRKVAGLEPKAAAYGGWETNGMNGHSLGHYMTACGLMYQATDDRRFEDRVNYIVDELELIQKANGTGYAGAVPNGKKLFADIAAGVIDKPERFSINGCWVPFYNLHKVYAGLMDAYRLCGNQKARTILTGLCDWMDQTTQKLNHEQMQLVLGTEHGGFYEVFINVFEMTGDLTYLNLAKRFFHDEVMTPLAQRKDQLYGLHANTQNPKILGAARMFEVTGDTTNKTIAEFYWETVVNHHVFANGGLSIHEHFYEPDQIAVHLTGRDLTETCNTHNMLKLTEFMYRWHPEIRQVDYYERALYNHILTSINTKDGMTSYRWGLYQPHLETYSSKENSFFCCTGTGMENHARYGQMIYAHDDENLFVNLFIPSKLDWEEKGIGLTMQTRFPDEAKINIEVSCKTPQKMIIHLRYPGWAESGMNININGKPFKYDAEAGSYIPIRRKWRNGDRIEIELPMNFRIEETPDCEHRVAIFYGPVLLAGIFEISALPDSGLYHNRSALRVDSLFSPILSGIARPFTEWIKPVPDEPLAFRILNMGLESGIKIIPIFRTHFKPYTVYWDAFKGAIPEPQVEPVWQGDYFHLDGVDDFIELPAGIVQALTDFTIACSVQVKQLNSWQRIFDFGNGTDINMFLTSNDEKKNVRFCITNNGPAAEQRLVSNTTLNINQWHRIAVRLDGHEGALFVDGKRVATNSAITLKPIYLGPTRNNWLGRSQYPDALFTGEIKDFRIYNRALGDEEIK